MELAPMRYKDFIWPHNPEVYQVELRQQVAAHKVPFGRYALQNMGMTQRVFKGEGEFVGPDAYEQIKKLGSLLYDNTAGVLVHPVWQTTKAYFVELCLKQEPRPDYVRYSFEFWEDRGQYEEGLQPVQEHTQSQEKTKNSEKQAEYYTVRRGDSLWGIAAQHGLSLSGLLEMNSGIRNPNLIYPGDQIRVG